MSLRPEDQAIVDRAKEFMQESSPRWATGDEIMHGLIASLYATAEREARLRSDWMAAERGCSELYAELATLRADNEVLRARLIAYGVNPDERMP